MANQEHVDILRQGVDVWNAWRKRHHEIQPDLSGVDLSRAILIVANLSIQPSSSIIPMAIGPSASVALCFSQRKQAPPVSTSHLPKARAVSRMSTGKRED